MHMGIKINPCMHTGIVQIPVFVRCDGADGANHCRSWRQLLSFTAAMAVIVECGGSQCRWRQWRSSSTTVVVDGGGSGMEPTAPIVVVDSGGKDAIAAAAIDRRRIRQ